MGLIASGDKPAGKFGFPVETTHVRLPLRRNHMRMYSASIGAALAVAAGMAIGSAQTSPTTVDGLVSAAKVAAGTDWSGTFTRLCIPPPPTPAAGRGGANTARTSPPPRETWHVEPAKVADNLYFLGEKAHHSWAIVGSDGIILIEALYDYMVADEVAGGLRKLGLDMNKVKYAVMSHAHGDHDGGAAFLQDSIPGVRLVYGAEDWDAVDKSTNRPGGKPKRDMVGADGQTLSVGDASIQIVTMPGHTAGNTLLPVRGQRQRQAAAHRVRRGDGHPVQWNPRILRSVHCVGEQVRKSCRRLRRHCPAVESHGVRQRLLQGPHGRLPEVR